MRLVEACPHDNVSGEISFSGVTSSSRSVDQHIHTATPSREIRLAPEEQCIYVTEDICKTMRYVPAGNVYRLAL